MEVFQFTLKGKTAFFKKPEFNSYYYFTYGNIHKVALLGMFGAILGYRGYGAVYEDEKKGIRFDGKEGMPEFYQRLQSLKIGIVPNHKKGYISKKMQTFNNSVGYASKEQGGNLIVKEQWLEHPSWNIYILLDQQEAENIRKAIEASSCVFTPYLGKNDHLADIISGGVFEVEAWQQTEEFRIDSLFVRELAGYGEEDEDDDSLLFKYEEFLPIGLEAVTGMYRLEKMVFTNRILETYKGTVCEIDMEDGKKKIAFF